MPGREDELDSRPGSAAEHTVSTVGALDESADPITPATGSTLLGAPVDYDLPVVSREVYRIERYLQRGGMGRVLRAIDLRLQRPVAIKEMLGGGAASEARFLREVRITARLTHPAIVAIHEAGRWPSGQPFYAMRLVEGGGTLAEAIGEAAAGTLLARLALLPHVLAAAEAVAFAHGHRVVHRDLKPTNILVGPLGETLVIDWGLAKDLGSPEAAPEVPAVGGGGDGDLPREAAARGVEPHMTQPGSLLGTPQYMPPEQAAGRAVDERADVYALGAILYHVLAGAPPYPSNHPLAVAAWVEREPPVPLPLRAPEVPADLALIVEQAMARDPSDRYPTARELAAELRRFQTGQLLASRRYGAMERAQRRLRPYVWTLAVAAVAAVALTLVTLASVRRIREQRSHAAAERATVAARLDGFVIAQARGALARDPALSIAWLAALPQESPALPTARSIAAEALARAPSARVYRFDGPVGALAFSPDGAQLAVAADEPLVRVVEMDRGVVSSLHGLARAAAAVAIASDGKTVAALDGGGSLVVWRGGAGAPLPIAQIPAPASQSAVRFFAAEAGAANPVGAEIPAAVEVAPEARAACAPHQSISAAAGPTAPGRPIACADHDGNVWVQRAGESRRILGRNEGSVTALALSGDGRWLAAAGRDTAVRLWDLTSGGRRALPGHEDAVLAVAFSPNGRRLASASRDRSVRLWDLPLPSPHVLGQVEGDARHLLAAPSALALAVLARGGAVAIWRGDGLARVDLELHGESRDAVISSDGRLIAAAGEDGVVRVIDVFAASVRELRGHVAAVTGVAFSESGSQLASSSLDGTARLWSLEGDAPSAPQVFRLDRPGASDNFQRVALSSITRRLAVSLGGGHFALWNIATGDVTRLESGEPSGRPRFSRDGHTFGVPGGACLAAWRLADLDYRSLACGDEAINDFAFTPDSRSVVAAAGHALRVAGIDGGTVRATRGRGEGATLLAVAPDGWSAITLGSDHALHLWNLDGEGERVVATGQPARLVTLAPYFGAARIAAITGGGVVSLVADDLPRGAELAAWLRARADPALLPAAWW